MSPSDYKQIRLNKHEAIKLITRLAKAGMIIVSGHGRTRMAQRCIDTVDLINVLTSPAGRLLGEPEFKDGSWRYAVATKRMKVVVSFNPEGTAVVVVSAMRKDLQ